MLKSLKFVLLQGLEEYGLLYYFLKELKIDKKLI